MEERKMKEGTRESNRIQAGGRVAFISQCRRLYAHSYHVLSDPRSLALTRG